MLLIIFNFIRQYWLVALGGILFVGAGIEHWEVSYLKNEITGYKSENAALKEANDQLSSALKVQNEAVAKLQSQAQAKALASAKALKAAQKDAVAYTRAAKRIRLKKTSGNSCKNMTQLLDSYIKQGE